MSQFSLLPDEGECLTLDLPGGHLRYWPHFIPAAEADELMDYLSVEVPWEQSEITIAGQRRKIPRLNAWYGERGADYSYSGRLFRALPWPLALQRLRARVEEASGASFNSARVNLYRDGRDSVDWHSDDEPELGHNPVIASISLGAVRRFQVKHKTSRESGPRTIELDHGSLLVMAGEFQHQWRHRLPKMPGIATPRINITFRRVTLRAAGVG